MGKSVKESYHDFPMLKERMNGKPLVYLDSAATTLKPQNVIERMNAFYASEYATVHRSVYEKAAHASERYETVRSQVAAFIDAESDREIIFTKGTTEAINLVAASYGRSVIKEGDVILVSAMEHHANIVPWKLLCEEKNAILKVIPITEEGHLDYEAYAQLLSEKVKVVAVTHVSNVLGTVNDIPLICRKAHAAGAVVVVDGAQAVAHRDVSMRELGCDFYAFSGHKMYGPTGIGVLYGRYEHLLDMPPYQGGGDMIETVTFDKISYQLPPLRFEAGTPPIAEVMGLGAAITYLSSFSKVDIVEKEEKLLASALVKCSALEGITIYGPQKNRCSVLSFSLDGYHPLDLATMLSLKGIAVRTGHLCAQPLLKTLGVSSVVRMSIGLYTTYNDIAFFIEALKEAAVLLKPELSY